MPRAWWCFARAAIRTGESSDDLKSWLFGTASCSSTGWVHLCDRLLRSRRGTPPHSLRPRISRSPCIIPAGLHGPRPDGSMPASSRRTVQPFDFPEISLFPLRASASRAAFQGIALQRLMRSAPGTASSISLKQLLCKPFSLCDLAHLSTPRAAGPTRKPLGHLPSPEDGPRTPTGQSLASEMPPSELSWRAVPRYSRSLITAGRPLLCSANGARLEQPG